MNHLINRLYEWDEHKSSDKPNSISTTTLIGPLYKAKLALDKAPKDESLVPLMYKRSSTIGTAFHFYAEHVFENDPNIVQELYREREIKVDGTVYTISGSCDLLEQQADGNWTIADWKTAYGKERSQDQLDKDRLQMSIYRWLLQDEYEINDTGYTLFVSQSNNAQGAYPFELMGIEETENYIEERLYAIENNDRVDCQDGIKYNGCTYCSWICEHRRK